jgi:phosphoenolpyruvate---glycerone phosphotransferase subunit DhaL
MSRVINTATLIAVLKETASGWSRHHDELTQLDSIAGDGDLGVTVELAGKALVNYLADPGEDDIGKILMKCGMQINKASPSTFGTLLASAFMEAGKVVLGHKEIEFKDLLLLGRSAVEGVKKRGKAEVGDKTLLDALVPAVEAFGEGLAKEKDYNIVLADVVKAAKAGAEATKQMKAKYSRASYRQDGAMGLQDAGATAIYYLIESFAQSLSTCI